MSTPRRALVATPRLPAPDRDRGSLRLLDMISALQGTGWDVTVCGLHDEAETGREQRRLEQLGMEVHVGLTADLGTQIEMGVFRLAVLARWVAAERVLTALRRAPDRPAVIVDSVDLHFLRHARYRSATAGAERNEHEANVDFFGRELDAYSSADAVLAVSEKERSLLAEVTGSPARVHVVPLSAPVRASPLGAGDRRGILFVGSFRHVPNVEAAEYLCASVLPRLDPEVLAHHPLSVVGGNLPEHLVDRFRRTPGVEVVGWLPDLVPYLHRARMSVVPLLHGAGVKGKVLESLASGTPVVATTVAVEGTGLQPGAHVAVADDAWQFASAVEALALDDGFWQRLADEGLAHVAQAHHPDDVEARFLAVVDAVLDAPSSHRPSASATDYRMAEHGRMLAAFERDVATVTPGGAHVLVVSGGDERLLRLEGRRVAHFPQDDDGLHARTLPRDGEAAVSHLRALADRGAEYLAVPSTSLGWLHRYPALHAHLSDRCRRVHRGEHASVYEIEPAIRHLARLVVAAPAVVAEAVRAVPPSTCTVDARVWDGSSPPPLGPAEEADLVVLVRPEAVLPPGFFDQLVARAAGTGLDVVQPAHGAGAAGPPASEAQGDGRARETAALAGAPVLAARPDAVPALLAALERGDRLLELAVRRTGVLDTLRVGVDLRMADVRRGTSPGPTAATWLACRDSAPQLTVVVPVWSVTPRLADLAHRTIERIWEVASVVTEVVAVDNGSPHPRDLRASVVRWPENRGVAPAWNAGAAAGGGAFLAFVNSDAMVEPGWDAALCAAAEGRRVAFPYTDHCDGLGFRRPDKAGTAGWAFVLSRALFDELGPFDEDFAPAYFEDTDYWHRAHERGVALNPVPAARVRHARRTTARHLDGFDEIFERNRRRYERKHGLKFEAAPPYWHRVIEDYPLLAATAARGVQ